METIVQDIRYAVRVLARSRGFTFAALLTLALGIGATTSIFSVLWSVVCEPLPFRDPSKLMVIWETDPHNGTTSEGGSYPDVKDFQAQSKTFETISGFYSGNSTITDPPREAERVPSALALWDTFKVLGVKPIIGRAFTAADDVKNAAPVVIISDELWRRRYNRGAVLDRSIMVDGKPHRQMDEVRSGGSYISQSDLRVHFGLGVAETADIEVRWPSGLVDKLTKVPVNRVITVVEGGVR